MKRGAINKYVEAEILNNSKLRHPHVIQFKVRPLCPSCPFKRACALLAVMGELMEAHGCMMQEVFLTSEYICIAMEYATGGSLFHYVQKQGKLKVRQGWVAHLQL